MYQVKATTEAGCRLHLSPTYGEGAGHSWKELLVDTSGAPGASQVSGILFFFVVVYQWAAKQLPEGKP